MIFIRRTSQFVVVAAVLSVGVLLVLNVTDVIGSGWRSDLADTVSRLFAPDQQRWLLALGGVAAAGAAVVLIAAQLAPAPKGRTRMLEVGHLDDGTTRMTGRATLRAVEFELRQIDGVTAATATMPRPKRVSAIVRIDDRASIADVENAARVRLDTPFWINLGLSDLAVDVTAEFDPRPPRVR